MKLITVKDYEEMSDQAAARLIQKVHRKPDVVLGLATGGTPEGLYKRIVEDYQNNQISYELATTFNLDEYAGMPPHDRNSYRYFMDYRLFNHLNIPRDSIHLPNGLASDLHAECDRYEKEMDLHGCIDLQILGLGKNGHIGFNEPGTSFQSKTHLVQLTDETRQANARYFHSIEEVPTHAITMGIASIMKSKEILLLVSGESKQKALQRLLKGSVDESFPASILNTHQNVTILADEKALALC